MKTPTMSAKPDPFRPPASPMRWRGLCGLYAITPDFEDTAELVHRVGEAIAGGAALVQYRNKSAGAGVRAEQARALLELCRANGVPLIVNDDVELARDVAADGVHLGRDDPALSAARAWLGSDVLIGVSCYGDLARARHAEQAGASYVAFGSFFASQVKPDAARPSIELLREARAVLRLPIVAIGGITAANAGALIEAGADAVAVISALFHAADTRAAARAFGNVLSPPTIG
jgi:thiamine-phosphate pyrophosphorylase